jgi:hypothetical protein
VLITDAELAVLAQLQKAGPSGVLSDLVEVVRRMPSYFWTDTADDLRTAEKRGIPGAIHYDFNHDSRGIVHTADSTVDRRRQAHRRKSA